MSRILAITVVCATVCASLADSPLTKRPTGEVGYATYKLATGQAILDRLPARLCDSIWDMTYDSNLYFGSMNWTSPAHDLGAMVIDWGDIPAGSLVDGFSFAYATDLSFPATIDIEIVFYGDYDGFNNIGSHALAGFTFTESAPPIWWSGGWQLTIDLRADPNDPNSVDQAFVITGNDLDGDGMVDFGYSYWFPNLSGLDSSTGPLISNPDLSVYGTLAAAEAALGIYDACDAFMPDPNDPNTLLYDYTFWFGGWDPNDPNEHAYAQFFLELFGVRPCGGPGLSGNYCDADIDGSADCAVDLADLATLLANYGATAGVTHDGGDLEGGDGDVDLADLAVLLAQYGDDCSF